MAPVSSAWMRKEMGKIGFNPDPKRGSSAIGEWYSKNCPSVYVAPSRTSCSGGVFNYAGYGGGCCSGGYRGGFYDFSDVIKDRNEVSFWDCIMAGFKEQAYANPAATLSVALGVGGAVLSAAPAVLSGVGSIFTGLGDLLTGDNK